MADLTVSPCRDMERLWSGVIIDTTIVHVITLNSRLFRTLSEALYFTVVG